MKIPRIFPRLALTVSLGLAVLSPLSAADPVAVTDPSTHAFEKIHGSLLTQEGTIEVSIRLSEPALVEKLGKGAKQAAGLSRQAQQAQLNTVRAQQERVASEVARLGGKEIARLSKVLNAVIVEVDAVVLLDLAGMAEVRSIKPLAEYELHLSATVPYIGAAIAQAGGTTGAGVTVAVLDSGVDYTHRNLGGAGTLDAYWAAYADPSSSDGLFPTDKVVGGYDFVGEIWPFGGLAPDEDPIDFEGHGTHVSDIIAGRSLDETHFGVAPGASLYAFKVCSAVSSSCSGIAILQGLEASLDPNGDDDISDAVDVVNMSLGASYGQIVDDSAAAVQNLTEYGVVVVVSAGNSGDKPYVTGSPSIAPGAISVAQTQVPGAKAYTISLSGPGVPGSLTEIRNTASLDWAPVDTDVLGEVVYGGLACADYAPEVDFTGKVVLIDRGICAISVKVDRAAKRGAVGVILANNGPGDPPSFSFGGSSDGGEFLPVPTLVITQDAGNAIKSWIGGGVIASFGPADFTSLAGSMVASSSRGPSFSFDTIKPDIGAPGASVSAVAGTGSGESAFGGTSGAAPMVAGAAALLLEVYPDLQPHEVKARLMNSAERDVTINPINQPGVRAPITRIGGGEVRVDQALATETLVYDAESEIASLSFGYKAITGIGQPLQMKRTLLVRNVGSSTRNYTLSTSFRDPADEASGAVSVLLAPNRLRLRPGQEAEVNVLLSVDASRLPDWSLNSGFNGGNGPLLSQHEFDGYVLLASEGGEVSVPWHILPRKASDNQIRQDNVTLKKGEGTFTVTNTKGATTGFTDLFALTGVSPMDYPAEQPAGSNIATPDLAAVGVRYLPAAGGVLQFAIATHDERTHQNYPAEFDVFVDTTGDGFSDYVLYTAEASGFAATGQNVTFLVNFNTGSTSAFFYTDADLNTQTAVLTVPMGAMGIAPGQPIGFIVLAFDNYFTGALTDLIDDNGDLMVYTPGVPRYAAGSGVAVEPGSNVNVPVTHDPAGEAASPSQMGLLGLHTDAQPGAWWSILPVEAK